jgi:hypothetical protein
MIKWTTRLSLRVWSQSPSYKIGRSSGLAPSLVRARAVTDRLTKNTKAALVEQAITPDFHPPVCKDFVGIDGSARALEKGLCLRDLRISYMLVAQWTDKRAELTTQAIS